METILITDDDRACLSTIQRTLERAGYSVEGAESVDAALHVIVRKPVDLIVCDYRMPGKTGLDLLMALNQQGSRIPVLMVSAHADSETEAEAARLGVAGLLHKPFRRRDLIEAVARTIQ